MKQITISIIFLINLCVLSEIYGSANKPRVCNTSTQDCCTCNNVNGGNSGNNTVNTIRRTYNQPLSIESSTAISITATDIQTLLNVGNSQQTLYAPSNTTSIVMDIGTADPNNAQTWTIPNGILTQLTQQTRLDFISEAEVSPIAMQTATNNFGTGVITHFARESVINDGVAYTAYQFLEFRNNNHIEDWGKVYIRNSDGQDFYNFRILSGSWADMPVVLGSSFQTISNYIEPDNVGYNANTATQITFDAFGTITTPFGTYECLRASMESTVTLSDAATGNVLGLPQTNYWVVWVTKEGFRFYARKPNQSASGNGITLTNLQINRIAPTTVLPIELLNFSAKSAANQTVTISWRTASEKDNATFEVQRTSDGKNFETIGTVRGAINSAQVRSYQLVDNTPSVGHNYYRLRQTDTNGNETFSPLEYVWIKPEKGFLNIYPNPANDILNIEFEQVKEMTITDAAGKTVKVIPIENGHLLQKQTISIQDLPTGVYFLQANIKGETKTLQFIKK